MTVSTTNNRVAYLGNGITTIFPFPNRFLADADIVVLQKNNTTGVVTTKILTTDYTLTGATGTAGGHVKMIVAPPTGTALVVYRDPVLTQPIDLLNGVPLNVETGPETGFDRTVLQAQRVKDLYDRTMRLHDGNDTVSGTVLAPALPNTIFAWGSDTAVIGGVAVDLTAYVVSPFIATLLDDTDQTIARATLGAVGTTGNETVAGVKAFTGANTHTGAETHTGIETFPTAAAGTSTTQIATTAFANAGVQVSVTWINAAEIGSAFAIAGALVPAITALNGTDIAYVDGFNDSLRKYRFDGSTWAQIGASLSVAPVTTPAIAALNGTDVAFLDDTQDSLRTYRFDGANWALVGGFLAIALTGTPALAALNATDVACVDSSSGQLRTYRFNGASWAQIGATHSIAFPGVPTIAALNSMDIAYADSTNDSLRTYRFNGSTWAQVGNSLALAFSNAATLAALNGTDVALSLSNGNFLATYRFDGTNWAKIGSAVLVASGGNARLAALNGTDVVTTGALASLQVYRFAFDIGN